MYKAKAKLNKGFITRSISKNEKEYEMYVEDEDTPMDIFSVAYSGCIAMCVKGYFYRRYSLEDLKVEVDLTIDYDNKKVAAEIFVARTEQMLKSGDREGILRNIKKNCKIGNMLNKDFDIVYNIESFGK